MSTTRMKLYPALRRVHACLHWLHLEALLPALALMALLAWGGAAHPLARRAEPAELTGASMRAPATTVTADGTSAPVLTRDLQAALDFVARRYRVSADALAPVFHAAAAAAKERQLDAMLIIAVISIESRFNPYSQSPMGAKGLMQIIPRYHRDKIPDEGSPHPLLDPVLNVKVGAQILQEYIQRQGGVSAGLQFYAGAADDEEQAYANKVLAEKRLIEQAVRARV